MFFHINLCTCIHYINTNLAIGEPLGGAHLSDPCYIPNARETETGTCWGHVFQMRCFTKVLTACHSRSHDTRCKSRGANPGILVPIPYKSFYQPGHLILPWSLIGFPHSSPPDRVLAAGHHLAKCYTLVMVEVLYTPHSHTNYVKCFGCLRKCCINVINYVNYNNYSAQ